MRRWFAVSVLVTTGVMVNVASVGTITSSLIVESTRFVRGDNP